MILKLLRETHALLIFYSGCCHFRSSASIVKICHYWGRLDDSVITKPEDSEFSASTHMLVVLYPRPHACLHTYTYTQKINKCNSCFKVGIVIYLYIQCKANETIYYNVNTQNLLLGSVPVQRVMCSHPILSWNSQRHCTLFFFAILRKGKLAFTQVLFLPSLCP